MQFKQRLQGKSKMASSLSFNPNVRDLLPTEVIERFRIIPMALKRDKLCLIARRPLTDQALIELKSLTGIEDYELQLVGDDVLSEYILKYKDGTIFGIL
jgi:hypothetical protein